MGILQTVSESGHITYHLNAEDTAFFDEVVSRSVKDCPRMMELLNKTPCWAVPADDEDWGVYEEDRGLLKIDENDGL